MDRRMFALLVFLSAGVSVTPAWAQISAEGSIRGQVKDEQGGILPGVTVTATSPTVARTATAVTDAEGSYRLLGLAPGTYAVSAELSGFSKLTRTNIVVRAGLNLVVDVTLAVGNLSEVVQVTAETPMLETQTTTQAVNISGEFQRQLPLGSRRDFSEFLELTPGITARGFDQATGGQVYMLRGSEIENHVVQFDGADVGSFRQGWASLYVNASTDVIADTQVKTGGADASQPLGVGVVINLATQSGTNSLKGAVSTVYQARSWNGDNNPAGTSAIFDIVQPDLSFGGPIVKDRAFYFGAYRYTHRNTGIARTAKQLSDLQALVPGFEPFDNQSRNHYYFAKGLLQPAPSHSISVFYQQDENPEDASTPTQARPYSVTAFGGYAVGGSWSGVWGSNVTTKAAASYNTKSVNGHFGVFDNYLYEGPSTSVCDSVFLSAGRWSCSASLVSTGGTGSISAQPSTKLTMSADLTYYKTGWAGTHELQTGIFLQPRLVFTSTTRYLNNGLTSENVVLRQAGNPSSGTVPYYRIQYDRTEQLTRDLQASDYAIYVQDSWKPSPRLTINGGIRLDWVKASDAIFDLEAQSSLEFGPRFGATYLLTADNANIIRFSAGRIHDIPQSGYLPNTGSSQAGYTEFYDLNLDGTFETAFVTPATTALSAAREIDPERHQSFTDEYIVGYRRQLPGQVALDVSWIRRYYRDMPALVEINHIYDGVRFTGLRDESQNSILRVTNNTWNTPVYTGLEITGTKRAKNMQVLVTYSRQWQHLDGTWQPIDPASFIQPGHFANDKGIGSIRGNETNSLSGTSMTRSPSWQDHVLRIGGSYQTFWDVMVASSFSYQSGPFSGPVVTRIAAPDPQFGPPTIVTSTGRTVSNPLATTIRFAYSDRGEGQIKAPNLVVWNLRFGKTFSFRGQSVEAAVDIFNVTNRGAAQQFLGGGNQLYSANYAVAPDGSFRGTSLQFARSSQLLLRYTF